ncbi:MAG TPA: lysylphosphatidylglycerol synthase transmembrane domain-containing protein [Nocardioidaceae bacterium]|jgi:uncharacterized membrane protein YbhN (UPF0104 family)
MGAGTASTGAYEPADTRRSRLRRLLPVARVVVPLLALVVLLQRFGAEAFRPALEVVSPIPLLAALVLGGVAVAAQSARWRIVMRGSGLPLGRREALVECYRSCALNTVLPGGVAGDVLRAWRQRTGAPKGWQPGAVSVAAERVAGFSVLLVAVSVVLFIDGEPMLAAAAATLASIAWLVTRRPLGRLGWRDRAAVWGLSLVALVALVGLMVVVAAAIGVSERPNVIATFGLVLLAGMSIPLNIGGWGPRETAGALVAPLVGAHPATGIAVAAGYGVLAAVSVLPGFLALALPRLTGDRQQRAASSDTDSESRTVAKV